MDTSAFTHLKLSLVDGGRTALLELDHGKANEMGSAQLRELEQLTHDLEAADGPSALISFSRRTSGKGTPIFIAGANVTERVGWSDEQVKQHVRWQRRVLGALRKAPCFHVAIVDGVALGWGTEFLLTSDYRLACDNATFGLPETGLGILPGAGGTSELWAQVGVAQALRLGMTGERIDADEALRIGLVQERVADVDAGLARALSLAARVAKNAPSALAAFKRAVYGSIGESEERRTEIEARAYEICVETGSAAVGRAHFDAIRAGEPVPWPARTPMR